MPGLLPLVLDTAINSDVPGPILAHLPGPVYSPKGVMLMEAGTQVIGKYESMGKGSRLMANSVYAHTPKGIWVPLTAQGMADDLGRSGLDGEVDRHLMQRFGAAVLLSLTDQGLQIVQAEASRGGNTYLSLNSGGGVSSLASQILQSQINIPATFTKHQGETMALFLDQPIDFSASYHVRAIKD
jgi:type IV secretion system protein VirB10